MTSRETILARIAAERLRQEKLFAHQNDSEGRWAIAPAQKLVVLTEELGEIARGLCDGDTYMVREKLLQVAAVCVRWLEGFDDDPKLDAEKRSIRDQTLWVPQQYYCCVEKGCRSAVVSGTSRCVEHAR